MSSPAFDDETLRFGRLLHYAGLAIVLVTVALAYQWFYSPVEAEILDAAMQIDALDVAQKNAGVILHEHERLTSHLQEIEARYSALEQRVPLNAEAGSFLKHISELADEEQLEISNYQPADVMMPGNGYAAMEVMLDGKGNFHSICRFFDRLSKIQRLSKVKDLSVSVDPLSEAYPMKATIIIYFGLKGEIDKANAGEVTRG
jgi:Tfp pilus assembly protein PilO